MPRKKNIDLELLHCRAEGHAWERAPTRPWVRQEIKSGIRASQRCDRCSSDRDRVIDRNTGSLLYSPNIDHSSAYRTQILEAGISRTEARILYYKAIQNKNTNKSTNHLRVVKGTA